MESSQFYKLNSNVVAKLTQTQPALCILFSAAVNNAQILNTSKLVEAISDIVPQTKIAGGQACVANKLKNTYVFNEQKILSRGAVFALFSNKNLNVSLFMSDGWKQIGMPLQVELSGERCVRKINGMSVRDIYQEYLDIPLKIGDLSHPTMQFPLMIRRGNLLKKNVPIAELEDGCVQFFNTFHKDDDVRFSYCDVSELEREVSEIKSEILLEAPEAIFFFSCSIRKKLFGLPVPIDTNELCKAAPTCSAFLSTEYYSDKRSESSSSFIQSLVGLTLSESKREPLEFKNEIAICAPTKEQHEGRLIIHSLTRLIAKTTNELEESNSRLNQLLITDSLTELYNRRHFDQQLLIEMKRHNRSQEPFTLILLDVDYFKHFNDLYGHPAGDDCLYKVATALRISLNRPSDLAFRYGGEEMGVLLASTDALGAQVVAERIMRNIRALKIVHKGSKVAEFVTVSCGVATYWPTAYESQIPRFIINECDKLLYEAKAHGRNMVVSTEIT